MVENSVWTSEHRVIGCEIDITGTAIAQIKGGKLELDGKWLTRDGSTTTGLILSATANAAWEEGTSQEGSATAWYVVAYNDSGNSFSLKFRNSAPAYSDTSSGTSTGPKQYDKTGTIWYKYLGGVLANSAHALVRYTQQGENVLYEDVAEQVGGGQNDILLLTTGSASTFTAASVGPTIPMLSKYGYFYVGCGAANRVSLRPEGSTATYGRATYNANAELSYTECALGDNHNIEFKSPASSAYIHVAGYKLNNRGN